MSEQLPPVEPVLRRQLTRRSAGTLPSGLLAQTLSRLDESPRRRWAFRLPRTIVALGSVAAVAVLALALVFVPSIRNGPAAPPAGYPADRALTTAELNRVLTEQSLPVNTALVAEVTIDTHTTCPSFPDSVGVVADTNPTVCVADNRGVDYPVGTMTATWAFRYLDPTHLRIVGQVVAASSGRLSYGVADAWPTNGAFLVRGYLGALRSTVPCPVDTTTGVEMTGDDCPYTNWLSDEPTAPLIEDKAANGWLPDQDQLSLRGTARYVEVGDIRDVDSISHDAPVRGVYVVQLITGPCYGLAPVDSRGCNAWRVLAIVPTLTLAATPTNRTNRTLAPSRPPLTGYPADRALTTAELAALMSGPALATNTTFAATVTIDVRNDVCPMDRAPTIGVIEGMPSQVCAMDQGAGLWQLKAMKLSGTYVFQYWAPGYLAVLAEVTAPAWDRLAFQPGEAWPTSGAYVVDAWIRSAHVVGNDPNACPGQSPDASGTVTCRTYWLSLEDNSDWRFDVQLTGENVSFPEGPAFVLLSTGQCDPPAAPGATCSLVYIVARLDDDPFAAVATATGTPPPTGTPPAAVPSPTPPVLPTTPAGAQPLGLWGSGNRPFTVAELPQIWAADPNHLANRIVIVKGPVPSGISCTATENGISTPGPCDPAVEMAQIAPEGYWAVKVGSNGRLTIVGQLALPSDGGFSFTGGLDSATERLRDQGLVIVVDGWLSEVTYDSCAWAETPPPNGCRASKITGTAPADPSDLITPQVGAYQTFTGAAPDVTVQGPPVRGLYLVLVDSPQHGTLLARLGTVQP